MGGAVVVVAVGKVGGGEWGVGKVVRCKMLIFIKTRLNQWEHVPH